MKIFFFENDQVKNWRVGKWPSQKRTFLIEERNVGQCLLTPWQQWCQMLLQLTVDLSGAETYQEHWEAPTSASSEVGKNSLQKLHNSTTAKYSNRSIERLVRGCKTVGSYRRPQCCLGKRYFSLPLTPSTTGVLKDSSAIGQWRIDCQVGQQLVCRLLVSHWSLLSKDNSTSRRATIHSTTDQVQQKYEELKLIIGLVEVSVRPDSTSQ